MSQGGKGKRKGSKFERDVCKTLSRYIDPKGTDTLFWRSAMSGGRATVQGRQGIKNQSQLGDITCVSKQGQWLTKNFVLECKTYKDLAIIGFILKRQGRLAKFWRQVKKLSKKNDRHPLLIAKQNSTPTLLITNMAGLQTLSTFIGDLGDKQIKVMWGVTTTYIMLFDEVFAVKKEKRS